MSLNHAQTEAVAHNDKETGEKFFYRIYDLELFHYLLYKLRSIRMEKKNL